LKEREPAMVEHRAKLQRRAQRHTAKETAKAKSVVISDGEGPLAETAEVEPERLGLVSANELARQARSQPNRSSRAQRKK